MDFLLHAWQGSDDLLVKELFELLGKVGNTETRVVGAILALLEVGLLGLPCVLERGAVFHFLLVPVLDHEVAELEPLLSVAKHLDHPLLPAFRDEIRFREHAKRTCTLGVGFLSPVERETESW